MKTRFETLGSDFFDRQGNAIDALRWGHLRGDEGYKEIVPDSPVGGATVRTCWLGEDLQDPYRDPPEIFGTAVLCGGRIEERRTYATEAEAVAGHWRVVAEVTIEERTKS